MVHCVVIALEIVVLEFAQTILEVIGWLTCVLIPWTEHDLI